MITLDGNTLTIEELVKTARFCEKIDLAESAAEAMEISQKRLKAIISAGKPVYGLNTGFGIFADKMISREESKQLNRNLIISHAVGTGAPLPAEAVRTAMIIRANTLSKGYSGIKTELVRTILEMLNKKVTPEVSSKGSLGSSGDLCMLAQMALVISKDDQQEESESGKAFFEGQLISGKEAMQKASIDRLVLENKDGLALINGATFSAALLALAVSDSKYLCYLADLAAALTYEALLGRTDPMHPGIHKARGLDGQIETASVLLEMLDGSEFVNSHSQVQDAYSLRCTPQVHGAVRDTLAFVAQTVTREINAATDNPLIVEEDLAISGGNFHGEAIGMNADFLGIAMSELSAISERRVFRMLDNHLNQGLPIMLVEESSKAGLNSGVMILQYTAASLVLENQTLCSPDSVRSLPTSANQEDFNANAYNAAYHTAQIIENAARIITTEIYTACRAIDLRKKNMPNAKLGKITGKAYQSIRKVVPFQAGDAYWKEELDKMEDYLFNQNDFRDKFYLTHLTK